MDDLLRNLGARVRDRRHDVDLTVKALAAASGLSVRYLVELENGRGNISVGRLAQVAEALDVPLPALLDDDSGTPRSRVRRLVRRLDGLDQATLGRVEAAVDEALAGRRAERPVVALLGVRGAGKSTVGPLAAERLGRPFVELDSLVEDAAGLSMAEIFSIHGEPYYRRVEYEVLTDFLDRGREAVLATGGSLVTHPETWSLLRRDALTVWLRARARDHWKRVLAQGDDRPMRRNPRAFDQLEALLAEREPLYRQADRAVDTTDRSVDAVVEDVVAVSHAR
ncbi:MAG: shikimate kinase [Myxococcota bacterium]